MARALVLVLTLIATLDFAMPGVPGAVMFDPDQCVEAAARPEGVEVDRPTAAPATVTSRVLLVTSDDTPTRAPVADWSGVPPPRRQAFVAEAEAKSPTDH